MTSNLRLSIILALLVATPLGCTKEEKADSVDSKSAADTEKSFLESVGGERSLLRFLPGEILGVTRLNLEHPAFNRWRTAQVNLQTAEKTAPAGAVKKSPESLTQILTDGELRQSELWKLVQQDWSEIVSGVGKVGSVSSFSLLAKARNPEAPKKLLAELRSASLPESVTREEREISGVKALVLTVDNAVATPPVMPPGLPGAPGGVSEEDVLEINPSPAKSPEAVVDGVGPKNTQVVLFEMDNLLGVAIGEQTASRLIQSSKDGNSLPAIMKLPSFEAAFASHRMKDVYGFAFFDTANLIPNSPLLHAAGTVSFDSISRTVLSSKPSPDSEQQLASLASGVSPVSSALLKLIPSKSITSLSFGGELIRYGIVYGESAAGAPLNILEQYPVLKNIRRVSLSVQGAATGQAILPIPNLIIGIETPNADDGAAQISKDLAALVQTSPMAQSVIGTERVVQGKKVMDFASPLGFQLSIAPVGETILVTNDRAFLDSSLAGKMEDSAPELLSNLVKGNSLLSFSFNGREAASMAESMSGVMSMYGAPAQGAPENEETLRALREAGESAGILTVENNEWRLEVVGQ